MWGLSVRARAASPGPRPREMANASLSLFLSPSPSLSLLPPLADQAAPVGNATVTLSNVSWQHWIQWYGNSFSPCAFVRGRSPARAAPGSCVGPCSQKPKPKRCPGPGQVTAAVVTCLGAAGVGPPSIHAASLPPSCPPSSAALPAHWETPGPQHPLSPLWLLQA